jgi:signal transduction histidine kinase
LPISVGRRLAGLVGVELATAAVLLVVAFVAYGRLASDLGFMHRYVLAPVEGISEALENAARLKLTVDQAPKIPPDHAAMERWAGDLELFLDRYRSEWAVADNMSRDAVAFRADLERADQRELLADEAAAENDIGRSLERLSAALPAVSDGQVPSGVEDDARVLRAALRKLLRVNMAYVEVENAAIQGRSQQTYRWMVVVGLLGLLGSLGLGLHVHRAIAPRIRRLVDEVRRFQDLGIHRRVLEEGRDEIAVLAHALDAGFASIAARDRERDEFLGVVAHELKTPMTSILGFTELVLERPESAGVRKRALDLVRSQASRLGRLIDDLLLAASARSGALPFRPQSVDMSVLVEKVAAEVTTAMPGRRFDLDIGTGGRLLADERLLTQAVWTLLTYAAAIAEAGRAVTVRLVLAGARVRLEVAFDAPTVPAEEIVRAFSPFASVQYEGGHGIVRSAVGLFLCREIARLHGGSVLAMKPTEIGHLLLLDLPA